MRNDLVMRLRRLVECEPDRLGKATVDLIKEAANKIENLRAERLTLDKKIRGQRRALRDNWQIVEQRWNWASGRRYREAYLGMLHRWNDLRKQVEGAAKQ